MIISKIIYTNFLTISVVKRLVIWELLTTGTLTDINGVRQISEVASDNDEEQAHHDLLEETIMAMDNIYMNYEMMMTKRTGSGIDIKITRDHNDFDGTYISDYERISKLMSKLLTKGDGNICVVCERNSKEHNGRYITADSSTNRILSCHCCLVGKGESNLLREYNINRYVTKSIQTEMLVLGIIVMLSLTITLITMGFESQWYVENGIDKSGALALEIVIFGVLATVIKMRVGGDIDVGGVFKREIPFRNYIGH